MGGAKVIGAGLLAAVLGACTLQQSDTSASSDEGCAVHWILYALESREATADAEAAIRRGGPRFLGVYGYALTSPGVTADAYCLRDAGLLWVIPDTSDDRRCGEHSRLNGVAQDYAHKYNSHLITRGAIDVPAKCAV